MSTLYSLDSHGKLRTWSVEQKGDGLLISYGLVNGKQIEKFESVPEGKVNRSITDQINLRINSRISKKKDLGYCETISEALKGKTNSMNLHMPMLAQRYDKVKNVDVETSYLQRKYDGHRYLITNNGGDLIAYSRNGKLIKSINHILDGLDIKEGQTLDGELYNHGTSLQTIGSWVRRNQAESANLEFVMYDTIEDVPFRDRLSIIKNISYPGIVLAETWNTGDMKSIPIMMKEVMDDGYEGLIIRQGDKGYESGKRSRSLIKVKKYFDDEFLVVDVIPSKDGWAIMVCSHQGKTFKCSAPGTMIDKFNVMRNKHLYIGMMVQIMYFGFTNDNIPFQPSALKWRNKGEE